MKKNILKFVLSLTVVAVAGYITYSSQTKTKQLSGITLENVEALGSGESRTGCKFSLQYICVTQNKDHISYRNL